MTATALISGTLFRDPEPKTSRGGRAYVLATVKVGQGDDVQWWRLMAFGDDARDELLGLRAGDGVAASGTLRAEVYAPAGGEARVSLSLMADRVISAKRQKREKAAEARSEARTDAKDKQRGGRKADPDTGTQDGLLEHAAARPFDDGVPF